MTFHGLNEEAFGACGWEDLKAGVFGYSTGAFNALGILLVPAAALAVLRLRKRRAV